MREKDRPIILMADDDEEDRILAREAFKAGGVRAAFHCVEDGVELMGYLSKCNGSKGDALPGLILLDLNMPVKDGREALLEIKSAPALQDIPIVILSTSEAQRDIDFTKKAGADSFITKPALFNEWVRIMKFLAERWLPG